MRPLWTNSRFHYHCTCTFVVRLINTALLIRKETIHSVMERHAKKASSCRNGSVQWTGSIEQTLAADTVLWEIVLPVCCMPLLVGSISVLLHWHYYSCLYTLWCAVAYIMILLYRVRYYLYVGCLAVGGFIFTTISVYLITVPWEAVHIGCIILCGLCTILPKYLWRWCVLPSTTEIDLEYNKPNDTELITTPCTATTLHHRKRLEPHTPEPPQSTDTTLVWDCF